MGIFDAIFGKPRKKSRRQVLKENQRRGKDAEERGKFWNEAAGWDMKREPKGQDYIASKINPFTGRKITRRKEFKSGNAKLSPLQKKTQQRHRGRYDVERWDGALDGLDNMSSDSITKKPRRRKGATCKRSPRRKSAWEF